MKKKILLVLCSCLYLQGSLPVPVLKRKYSREEMLALKEQIKKVGSPLSEEALSRLAALEKLVKKVDIEQGAVSKEPSQNLDAKKFQ
jgi:hypothetical protein